MRSSARIARAAMHRLELEQQVSDRTYELAATQPRTRGRQPPPARWRASRDTLTGLANRRYLMQQFPRLIAEHKAERTASPS